MVRFDNVAGLTQEVPTSQREHVHQGIQNVLFGTLHGLGFQQPLQNSAPRLPRNASLSGGLPAFQHIIPERFLIITAVESFPHNLSWRIWSRGFDPCFFPSDWESYAFIEVQIFNWNFCLVSWARLRVYDVWSHGACPLSFLTCMTSSLCEILLRGFMEELLGCGWEILMAYVIDYRLDPSLCPCFFVVVQSSMQSVVFVLQKESCNRSTVA